MRVRRRAWQGREVVLEPERWPAFEDESVSVERGREAAELLAALQQAVRDVLTPHQREVFTALALNEVPIDVLSERMGTTRGALYKTLHDGAPEAPGGADGRGPHGGNMTDRNDLERLLGPTGPDIGCEECFERLDEYVELELQGRDAEVTVPGMRAHLDGCPACREEHESLHALLS